MREITVALAGNPNAGKTTVFNALTGLRQHVGNYPGVTVEKKEGIVEKNGVKYRIVDLPGTYSLSSSSPEEVVTREYLVMNRPDIVTQVVDAGNMERNLYLATQIMELGIPLVVALNMSDVAKARSIEYDMDLLSILLKAPVVPTVGHKEQGMDALLDAIARRAEEAPPEYQKITYPKELERPIAAIDDALAGAEDRALADRYPGKWLAARLFESDPDMTGRVRNTALPALVAELRGEYERDTGSLPEIAMAEARYGWVAGLCAETMRATPEANSDASDHIDAVMLHRLLGLPIFLALMYLMFHMVFTLAETPMRWMERGFAVLGSFVGGLWPEGTGGPLRDLLTDGVIGGVGGVLVFLPNIVLLFLAIAFLEGTGYMARAAFIMDRFMHKIGLHGKSFIPMLLGFGCNVPAIMAARTLENRRDRLTTILVLPFMSCGARLPVYALLVPAFFPEHLKAWMVWLMYVIGIVFAVVGARLLRATLFRGESIPFVMELPPYRMPSPGSVAALMWDRSYEYVRKAGTVILAASILLWALTAYPATPDVPAAENMPYSYSGRIGRFLEPVFKPLGFDWRVVTAILGSHAAKEVFVAQLGIAFSVEEADDGGADTLRERLREAYSPLQGFCMMLWSLLSLPCVATIAVTRREAGGWKWAAFMMASTTAAAYLTTLAVYQAGSALGIGAG